ncbi:MAG: EAL domain-containing protein [Cyanophyceae cyanobacterium]
MKKIVRDADNCLLTEQLPLLDTQKALLEKPWLTREKPLELEKLADFEELICRLAITLINSGNASVAIGTALQAVGEFFHLERIFVLQTSLAKPLVWKVRQEWSASGRTSLGQVNVEELPNLSELDALQIALNRGTLAAQDQISLFPVVVDQNLLGAVGFEAEQAHTTSHRRLHLCGEMLANAVGHTYQAERQRLDKLWTSEELAQVTLQSLGDAVIATDWRGRVRYLNPAAEQLTGWTTAETAGKPFSEAFKLVREDTEQPLENLVERILQARKTIKLFDRLVLIARNGSQQAVDISATPIGCYQGVLVGTVLVLRDNTRSRNLAHQLTWQATHDTLTKLINRRGFKQYLAEAIASAQHNTQHALCYLDLDQFKVVNDTCGHVAGDELLCQVSALLKKQIRSTDLLARLGGDEFGLLLYNCPIEKAEQIAHTLQRQIQEFRFVWDGKSFTIGASLGLVEIDRSSQNLNSILGAADAACYGAKERGRNCIQVYRSNDEQLVRQRGERQWILRINSALEEDRFCLYAQKIAPIGTADAVHYEILLRLRDEQGALVPPMAFIPAAERYSLMTTIDRWVIRTFFEGYSRYYQASPSDSTVYTINLSGTTVNSDRFTDFLKEQFAEHGVPPQAICFEITETTAVGNLARAAQLIGELKQLGCRFALDDFGSGMSSLAYLKNLPVDYLKIDGSFVKNITSDRVNYALVECFNRVGQVMGMQTVAEFVENDATLEKLRHLGVNYAQGYGIGKPGPLEFGSR